MDYGEPDEDDLCAARGVILALPLALAMWAVVICLVWWVL